MTQLLRTCVARCERSLGRLRCSTFAYKPGRLIDWRASSSIRRIALSAAVHQAQNHRMRHKLVLRYSCVVLTKIFVAGPVWRASKDLSVYRAMQLRLCLSSLWVMSNVSRKACGCIHRLRMLRGELYTKQAMLRLASRDQGQCTSSIFTCWVAQNTSGDVWKKPQGWSIHSLPM